jgi:hypothetical protein
MVARLIQDDRVSKRITLFCPFSDETRALILEQFAIRQCKQSNIDQNYASIAGFIQAVKQSGLILKAVEADSLPIAKKFIKLKWQKVEKAILKCKSGFYNINTGRMVQFRSVSTTNN